MRFIFVVGVGRSGTSLLQSILASHPDVKAYPETSFLRRFAFSRASSYEEIRADKAVNRVKKLSALDEPSSSMRWTRALVDHYVNVYSDTEKKWVLDKDPRLVEFIPELRKFFPQSAIVHIFRDPRDVLASKMSAQWSSGRGLVSYLIASRVQILDARKAERAGQVLSVRYEDLLDDPSKVVQRLCLAMGLPFTEQMLSFQSAARTIVQPSELSWKKETLEPINPNNKNKWREELYPVHALSAALVVRKFCNDNDYEVDISGYSLYEKCASVAVVCVSVLGAFLYRFFRYMRKL